MDDEAKAKMDARFADLLSELEEAMGRAVEAGKFYTVPEVRPDGTVGMLYWKRPGKADD